MEAHRKSNSKEIKPQPHASPIHLPRNATPEEQLALRTLARLNGALEQLGLPAVVPPNERKPQRRSRRRRPTRKPARPPADVSRLAHEAHCSICSHDLCQEIEQEFVHWESPRNIAEDYQVPLRAVYRHANALNLFPIRDANLRFALGRTIERTERMHTTPECILRAVQYFAKINTRGQWVEPPKHLIVSEGPRVTSQAAPETYASLPRRRSLQRPAAARTQSRPLASARLAQQSPPRNKRQRKHQRSNAGPRALLTHKDTRNIAANDTPEVARKIAQKMPQKTPQKVAKKLALPEPAQQALPAAAIASEPAIPTLPPTPPISAPPPQLLPRTQLIPGRADPPFIYDLPGSLGP